MNQRNKEQHNIRQNLPTAEKVNLFLISIFVFELQGFFFFFLISELQGLIQRFKVSTIIML